MHRINPLINLHWRHFDDEWVVFESLSGQTHQLSSLSAAVLMCFEPGLALSASALITTLKTDFHLSMDESQMLAIEFVVHELVALGIVVKLVEHAAR